MKNSLTHLAPLLLVIVAGAQLTCVTHHGLTPWKGGGFGMFATINSPSNRFLSIVGTDGDGKRYRILLQPGRFTAPAELSSEFIGKLLTIPTRRDLAGLATAVLNAHIAPIGTGVLERLRRQNLSAEVAAAVEAIPILEVAGVVKRPGAAVDLREVTVAALRLRFDAGAATATLEQIGGHGKALREPEYKLR